MGNETSVSEYRGNVELDDNFPSPIPPHRRNHSEPPPFSARRAIRNTELSENNHGSRVIGLPELVVSSQQGVQRDTSPIEAINQFENFSETEKNQINQVLERAKILQDQEMNRIKTLKQQINKTQRIIKQRRLNSQMDLSHYKDDTCFLCNVRVDETNNGPLDTGHEMNPETEKVDCLIECFDCQAKCCTECINFLKTHWICTLCLKKRELLVICPKQIEGDFNDETEDNINNIEVPKADDDKYSEDSQKQLIIPIVDNVPKKPKESSLINECLSLSPVDETQNVHLPKLADSGKSQPDQTLTRLTDEDRDYPVFNPQINEVVSYIDDDDDPEQSEENSPESSNKSLSTTSRHSIHLQDEAIHYQQMDVLIISPESDEIKDSPMHADYLTQPEFQHDTIKMISHEFTDSEFADEIEMTLEAGICSQASATSLEESLSTAQENPKMKIIVKQVEEQEEMIVAYEVETKKSPLSSSSSFASFTQSPSPNLVLENNPLLMESFDKIINDKEGKSPVIFEEPKQNYETVPITQTINDEVKSILIDDNNKESFVTLNDEKVLLPIRCEQLKDSLIKSNYLLLNENCFNGQMYNNSNNVNSNYNENSNENNSMPLIPIYNNTDDDNNPHLINHNYMTNYYNQQMLSDDGQIMDFGYYGQYAEDDFEYMMNAHPDGYMLKVNGWMPHETNIIYANNSISVNEEDDSQIWIDMFRRSESIVEKSAKEFTEKLGQLSYDDDFDDLEAKVEPSLSSGSTSNENAMQNLLHNNEVIMNDEQNQSNQRLRKISLTRSNAIIIPANEDTIAETTTSASPSSATIIERDAIVLLDGDGNSNNNKIIIQETQEGEKEMVSIQASYKTTTNTSSNTNTLTIPLSVDDKDEECVQTDQSIEQDRHTLLDINVGDNVSQSDMSILRSSIIEDSFGKGKKNLSDRRTSLDKRIRLLEDYSSKLKLDTILSCNTVSDNINSSSEFVDNNGRQFGNNNNQETNERLNDIIPIPEELKKLKKFQYKFSYSSQDLTRQTVVKNNQFTPEFPRKNQQVNDLKLYRKKYAGSVAEIRELESRLNQIKELEEQQLDDIHNKLSEIMNSPSAMSTCSMDRNTRSNRSYLMPRHQEDELRSHHGRRNMPPAPSLRRDLASSSSTRSGHYIMKARHRHGPVNYSRHSAYEPEIYSDHYPLDEMASSGPESAGSLPFPPNIHGYHKAYNNSRHHHASLPNSDYDYSSNFRRIPTSTYHSGHQRFHQDTSTGRIRRTSWSQDGHNQLQNFSEPLDPLETVRVTGKNSRNKSNTLPSASRLNREKFYNPTTSRISRSAMRKPPSSYSRSTEHLSDPIHEVTHRSSSLNRYDSLLRRRRNDEDELTCILNEFRLKRERDASTEELRRQVEREHRQLLKSLLKDEKNASVSLLPTGYPTKSTMIMPQNNSRMTLPRNFNSMYQQNASNTFEPLQGPPGMMYPQVPLEKSLMMNSDALDNAISSNQITLAAIAGTIAAMTAANNGNLMNNNGKSDPSLYLTKQEEQATTDLLRKYLSEINSNIHNSETIGPPNSEILNFLAAKVNDGSISAEEIPKKWLSTVEKNNLSNAYDGGNNKLNPLRKDFRDSDGIFQNNLDYSPYNFSTKRLLLMRDSKDRFSRGNGLGMRIIGGQTRSDGLLGTFVEEILANGPAEHMHGEILEGDEILEWNGISLIGKTFEEVQNILNSPGEEIELVVRVRPDRQNAARANAQAKSTLKAHIQQQSQNARSMRQHSGHGHHEADDFCCQMRGVHSANNSAFYHNHPHHEQEMQQQIMPMMTKTLANNTNQDSMMYQNNMDPYSRSYHHSDMMKFPCEHQLHHQFQQQQQQQYHQGTRMPMNHTNNQLCWYNGHSMTDSAFHQQQNQPMKSKKGRQCQEMMARAGKQQSQQVGPHHHHYVHGHNPGAMMPRNQQLPQHQLYNMQPGNTNSNVQTTTATRPVMYYHPHHHFHHLQPQFQHHIYHQHLPNVSNQSQMPNCQSILKENRSKNPFYSTDQGPNETQMKRKQNPHLIYPSTIHQQQQNQITDLESANQHVAPVDNMNSASSHMNNNNTSAKHRLDNSFHQHQSPSISDVQSIHGASGINELTIIPDNDLDIISDDSKSSHINAQKMSKSTAPSGQLTDITLNENISIKNKQNDQVITSTDDQDFGEIELIISFDDYDQSLTIHISRARGLMPMDLNGLADPFVRVRLHPDPTEDPDFNRQTKYIDNTLEPEWQQTMVFMNCLKKTLKKRVLEVTIWDFDRLKTNDFMGQTIVNLSTERHLLDGRPHWFKLHSMQPVVTPGMSRITSSMNVDSNNSSSSISGKNKESTFKLKDQKHLSRKQTTGRFNPT